VLPKKIEIITESIETQLTHNNIISIRLLDQDGNSFDNCTNYPLEWRMEPEGVFVRSNSSASQESRDPEACVVRSYRAETEGRTLLTVIDPSGLQSSVILYSYPPLKVIQPQDSHALVTLGSSATYVLHGGPEPHS